MDRSNKIGDVGAAALAEALVHCEVTGLRLGDNEISDVGAVALANAIKPRPNPWLAKLELDGNAIGNAGAEALEAALQCCNGELNFLALSLNPDLSESVMHRVEALATQQRHQYAHGQHSEF